MTSGSGSRYCIIAFTIADTEITAGWNWVWEWMPCVKKLIKGKKCFAKKGIFMEQSQYEKRLRLLFQEILKLYKKINLTELLTDDWKNPSESCNTKSQGSAGQCRICTLSFSDEISNLEASSWEEILDTCTSVRKKWSNGILRTRTSILGTL